MVIVEVVSKSRGSLQFKNAIGMTEEKYQKIFLPKYKRSSSSSRGSDSSNTSLHNDTASNTRIAQKDSSVNTEFMQNSQNNSEAKKFLKVLDTEYLNATESGDVETAQRLVDEVGKTKNDGLYHIYDLTKKIRDTANRINGLERPKPNRVKIDIKRVARRTNFGFIQYMKKRKPDITRIKWANAKACCKRDV